MNLNDLVLGRELVATLHCQNKDVSANDEGTVVLVDVLPASDSVQVTLNGSRSIICQATSQQTRSVLNQIKEAGLAQLTSVLAINADRMVLQVRIFQSAMNFPAESPLEISVTERVADDLPARERDQLTEFMKREFLFADMAFAIARTKVMESDFTLIGPRYLLDVSIRRLRSPRAMRVKSRRKGWIPTAPVRLLRGAITFKDATLATTLKTLHSNELSRRESAGEYLGSWDAYNELENHHLRLRLNEFGVMRYTRRSRKRIEGRIALVFELAEPVPADLRYQVIDLEASNQKLDLDNDDGVVAPPEGSIYVGEVLPSEEHDRRITTLLAPDAEFQSPPNTGYLMPSVRGTKVQIDRRRRALVRVQEADTPLVTLEALLETGDAPVADVARREPRSKRSGAALNGTPTPKQVEALDLALNTPDIALIQGPPGTGKTSVIRALITRWSELQDQLPGQEEDQVRRPILVCSAQHDAVDNAVEGFDVDGLPAYRLGGRYSGDQDVRIHSMSDWIEQRRQLCGKRLQQIGPTPARQLARDVDRLIEQWRSVRGADDRDILRQALTLARPHIPVELATKLGAEIVTEVERQSTEPGDFDDGEATAERLKSRLVELVEAQRLNVDTFRVDGSFQAARLLRFLEGIGASLSLDVRPLVYEASACKPDSDVDTLDRIVAGLSIAVGSISAVLSHYSPAPDPQRISNTVDEILQRVSDAMHEVSELGRDGVAEALAGYIEELEDLESVRTMIEKYSGVVAATCQQSVMQDYARRDYDLVIVDEAARVNPMDLLIPLSHGRKLVLVGDHKQLPHMLEPEVRDSFLKSGRGKLEFVEQSLFQRLFEKLSKVQDRGGPQRVVTLSDDYRMHPLIGRFVSDCFYNGSVTPQRSEAERAHDLGFYNNKAVAWIDVPLSNGPESRGRSKWRPFEITVLVTELKRILHANSEFTVGIITFYEQQATRTRVEVDRFPIEMRTRTQVGTVDSFQGREFDVVILACVRSNGIRHDLRARVGFLESDNRLCVAFSRAKRLLVVVGDAETVAGTSAGEAVQPFWKFLQLCKENGWYEQRN